MHMPLKSVSGKTVIEAGSFVMNANDPTAMLEVDGLPLKIIIDPSVGHGAAQTSKAAGWLELRTGDLPEGANTWIETQLGVGSGVFTLAFILTMAGSGALRAYNVTYTITA